MKRRTLYWLNSCVTTTVFLLAVFVPLLIGVFNKNEMVSEGENRYLDQMPDRPRTLEELNAFPKLFDSFYSDQFGLREWFTELYSQLKFQLGDSPSENVTVGKDGWLFLGSVKNNKNRGVINDARNVNLYTETELRRFARYIAGLDSWLSERNIQYLFVLAPNKHTIYFDKLPHSISKVGSQSATDQLVGYLEKHTEVHIVDLREKLIREKENHQLYFKTDTHWNQNGANIAQYEIMKVVEVLFPNKIVPELFSLNITEIGGGDLSRMIGVDSFTEVNSQPIFEDTCSPIKDPPNARNKEPHLFICEGQELDALIFRDSFFNALQPYFSRKFHHSRYISKFSSLALLEKYIKLDPPDLVIEEWVERNLPLVPKTNQEYEQALVKDKFSQSRKVIFSSDTSEINFNKWLIPLASDDEKLHFEAIGKDPNIFFPPLAFEADKSYGLRIKMESSVDSSLQVFCSDAQNIEEAFSSKNSVRSKVFKGENDLYINLDQKNLGARLRLDPLSGLGKLKIELIEIRELEMPF